MTESLRAATPNDAGALAAILGAWIAETQWMPKLHSPDENHAFLTHLINTQTVRMVDRAGFLSRLGNEVTALYLAPPARGKGLGTAMLQDAKAAMDRLCLWTFQANLTARRVCLAQGFEEIERTDGAANEERLPDVRMEWRANRGN